MQALPQILLLSPLHCAWMDFYATDFGWTHRNQSCLKEIWLGPTFPDHTQTGPFRSTSAQIGSVPPPCTGARRSLVTLILAPP